MFYIFVWKIFFSLVRLLVIVHLFSNGISDVTAIECYQCSDVDARNSSEIPLEKMDRNCRNPDNKTLTCNDTQSCFTIFAIYDYKNDTAREITRGCGEGSLENLKFETGHMKKYKIEKCVLAKCNVINVTDTIIYEKFHQEKKLNVEKGKNHTLESQDKKRQMTVVECHDCLTTNYDIKFPECLDLSKPPPSWNPHDQGVRNQKCKSQDNRCVTMYFYAAKFQGKRIYSVRRGCLLDRCGIPYIFLPDDWKGQGISFDGISRRMGQNASRVPVPKPQPMLHDNFSSFEYKQETDEERVKAKTIGEYKCFEDVCSGQLCNLNEKLNDWAEIIAFADKGHRYEQGGGQPQPDKEEFSNGFNSPKKITPKLYILILLYLLR